MLYTTLNLLRKAHACSDGMATLKASLPKLHSDDKQISLAHILKSNGLQHAFWALRATTVDGTRYAQRMAIDFALECLPIFEKIYPEDRRPRTAIEAAGLFLDGKITLREVEDAANAAYAAAANAADNAANAAAYAAAYAAANAAYAAANAKKKHLATCADIVRKHIPLRIYREAIKKMDKE